jgi:hypothetical protein
VKKIAAPKSMVALPVSDVCLTCRSPAGDSIPQPGRAESSFQ